MSQKKPIFVVAMDRKRLIAMFAVTAMLVPAFTSCREEELIQKPVVTPVGPGGDNSSGPVSCLGFYLLNEGNMGSNKSTLDWFDATNEQYVRNIYGAINPDVPKELGDVGNDLQIYGSRLYAVINCSNKVEILDAATCRRLGQVNIPNCRYIAFDGPYAYVTSYAGPVRIDPEYKQIGYVAKIDTATMAVVDTVHVGFQPDGLAVAGRRLYVANSGGYMVPNYENTVSVIDIPSFKLEKNIEIAINLHNIIADSRGQLTTTPRVFTAMTLRPERLRPISIFRFPTCGSTVTASMLSRRRGAMSRCQMKRNMLLWMLWSGQKSRTALSLTAQRNVSPFPTAWLSIL